MADAKIRLSIDGVQAVTGGLKDVGEKIGSVSRSISALTAIAGTLSIGAFVGIIKESIDAADGLKDLSKSTAIAVEDLAGLKLLARQTGTDLDGLARGINKMSVEMGKSPEKFKALGITAKDNIGAFKQLADMFNKLEDANLRNALAQSIFGKSWAELAPALSEGGKAIGETIEKGKRLSGVTTEMADAADAFNDKMAELAGTGGLMTRLVGPALPLMNALADDMVSAANAATTLDSSFNPLTETLRALIVFGGNVAFVFKGIGTEIGGIAAQVALFASGDFKAALMVGDMMKADADKARSAFDAWEAKMMAAGTAAKSAAKETVVMTQAQKDAAKASEQLAKKFLDDAADKQKSQDSFVASLIKESETLRLGEAEAKLHQAAILGITGAKLNQVKAIVAEIDAYKEAVKIARARSDERKKEEEGLKEYARAQTESYNAAVKGSQDALKAAQAEYDQYGMTKSQIAEITLLTLESTQAKFIDGSEGYNAAQKQIDAQRELIDVLKRGEARDASIKAAKDTGDEWKSAWDSIDRTAHDTFVSIFDSGKSAFDRLKDTLKNGLIDMLYQMTIKKWIINISATGSMAGASSAANAANTGSSLLNAGSTVASIFSAGSAMAGGSLASIASGSTYGTAFLSEQSLMLAAQEGTGLAASGLSGMSSISGALAAIPGWGWAALAAAAVAAYLINDGPETSTRLNFASNSTAGNISINERGNEGKSDSYIGGYGTSALGTFGVNSTFWMDSQQEAVQSFIKTVSSVDDAFATFMTAAEKAAVSNYLTGQVSIARTGAEGTNPNANGELDKVFAERVANIFEGLEGGLSRFVTGFAGTSQQLATEAAAILEIRSNLDKFGVTLGRTITLDDLDAMRLSGETLSATVGRIVTAFNVLTVAQNAYKEASAAASASLKTAEQQYQSFIDAVTSATNSFLSAQSAILAQYNSAIGAQTAANSAVNAEQEKITDGYLAASQRVAAAQSKVIDGLVRMSSSLKEFLGTLETTDLGGTSSAQQYAVLKEQFISQSKLAMGGDESAAGSLSGIAQNFLKASQTQAVTSVDFARDVANVKNTISDVIAMTDKKVAVSTFDSAGAAILSAADELIAAQKDLQAWSIAVVNSGASYTNASTDLMSGYKAAVAEQSKTVVAVAYWSELAVSAGIDLGAVKDEMRDLGQALINGFFESKTALDVAEANLQAANAIRNDLDFKQTTALQNFVFAIIDVNEKAKIESDAAAALFAAASDELVKGSDASSQALVQAQSGMEYWGSVVSTTAQGIANSVLSMANASSSIQQEMAANTASAFAAITAASASAVAAQLKAANDAAGAAKSVQINEKVSNAYSAIGRVGFGDDVSQIDAGGFDYWAKKLESGALALFEFQDAFLNSVAAYDGPNKEAYASRMQLAKSLIDSGIDIPGFAVGTNFVPKDMLANIHAGERIIPAADNAELMTRLRNPSDNNAALIAEIRSLREEVKGLRQEQRTGDQANVGATKQVWKLLNDVTDQGTAIITTPATT